MKKVLIGILIGGLGAATWNHFHPPAVAEVVDQDVSGSGQPDFAESAASAERFKCDGRVYCSEMTSCEEAEFFLENCPGVKMDGGNDGVPCERQWCGNR